MRAAWVGIAVDVDESLRAESEEMRDALRSGDVARVKAAAWPALRDSALAGIRARCGRGELGPSVAEILRMRVQEFDLGWRKL
jgi:hypothetical protein